MIKKHKEHRFTLKHRDSKKYHKKPEKTNGGKNANDRNIKQVTACLLQKLYIYI